MVSYSNHIVVQQAPCPPTVLRKLLEAMKTEGFFFLTLIKSENIDEIKSLLMGRNLK